MACKAVPDQSKHYLFIKPLERDAVTNMNVVTTKRIYNFVLRTGRPGGRIRSKGGIWIIIGMALAWICFVISAVAHAVQDQKSCDFVGWAAKLGMAAMSFALASRRASASFSG